MRDVEFVSAQLDSISKEIDKMKEGYESRIKTLEAQLEAARLNISEVDYILFDPSLPNKEPE